MTPESMGFRNGRDDVRKLIDRDPRVYAVARTTFWSALRRAKAGSRDSAIAAQRLCRFDRESLACSASRRRTARSTRCPSWRFRWPCLVGGKRINQINLSTAKIEEWFECRKGSRTWWSWLLPLRILLLQRGRFRPAWKLMLLADADHNVQEALRLNRSLLDRFYR